MKRFDPSADALMDLLDKQGALDEFVEVESLGRGTFGQALLMKSWRTGLKLVAKRLQLEGTARAEVEKLENEVRVCARLRHPNIVHYLGTFVREGKLLICLEYAAGGTLAARIDHRRESDEGPFEVDVATTWIAQIASAVSYMHSMHVLHRDLSAANVFLSAAADIKVGDFGLSKEGTSSVSVMGKTVCGTPNYFSPELISGQLYGAPADAWSVGLLVYEVLTLRQPFSGNNLAGLVQKILAGDYDKDKLASAPYPEELKIVASREGLLHPDPQHRPTLDELLARPIFGTARE